MNKITIENLIKNIKIDKITIDFGNLFLNIKNPKEYLINSLKNFITIRNFKIESHKNKILLLNNLCADNSSKINYNKDCINFFKYLIVHKNGLLEFDYRPLAIEAPMLAEKVNLCLINNNLTFVNRENYILEERLKPNPITWNSLNVIEPTEINCKSGKLIFANHFNNLYGDIPSDLQYKQEFNICGILGRRNTQKYLAENFNLGYGQTSNTSLDFYSNGTEIIGLEYAFDFLEKLKDYEDKNFTKDVEDLKKYMVDFENCGNVSMGVWRYEFIDKQNFNGDSFTNDFIEVPITKGVLQHYHYYGEHIKSPINPLIKVHIIQKQ